ncbi:putative uncharacterized protein DDB_G0282133 [Teleopsis dalmanni]|uniref:putative uncharacterized protein DDB_G0282133 n=1 Tax=Teleopsis dalmanni TaxID=139649 RepID=UPI0018CC8DA6|nr:putative uncharacterized protein DDB_G0282133 [Teleopsis dalmanni]
MAFTVEVQSCQSRPQSDINNNVNSTVDNNQYRKSRGSAIHDPGATNSRDTYTNSNLQSYASENDKQFENRWKHKEFITISEKSKSDKNTERENYYNTNPDESGANTANENRENSYHKSTLFTKVGTINAYSEKEPNQNTRFSKEYNYGNAFERSEHVYNTPASAGDYIDRHRLQLYIEILKQFSEYNFGTRTTPNTYCDKNKNETNNNVNGDANANYDFGVYGRNSVDKYRLRIPSGYEWSNAYCYS